jgi:LemA protein
MIVAIIVIAALVVILALWLVLSYNGLVRLRNRIENAWSQIDVQLKRRYDLIPNLIETVKGYAAHERETLEAVIAARQRGLSATTVAEEGQANNMMTQALGRLFAVAEAYPDLKANQNFLELQEELTATEDRIGYARQFYNDAVLKYDNKRQAFPTVIVARFGSFPDREYFEIEEPAAREVPRVQF